MKALRADYRRRVVRGLVLSQDMENLGAGRPEFQGTHFAHRGIRQGVVNSANMSRRKSLLGVSAVICVIAVAVVVIQYRRVTSSGNSPNSWNEGAIKGTLAAVRVRELDPTHAAVIFFYDLENRTDTDYRLASGPSVVIMSRLQSNGILSGDQQINLDAAAFVPAKNRTRIALEITHAFDWPTQRDGAGERQLRQFVADEVSGLTSFVLFDQSTHYQIELATSSPELQTEPSSSAQN